jgi:hypothetical protein
MDRFDDRSWHAWDLLQVVGTSTRLESAFPRISSLRLGSAIHE